jgi:putative ABC transport system permease protein
MISLILKFTFRGLRRNVFYHLISIAILSLAFAAANFILVWIIHELSYDRMHPADNRLYRLTWEYDSKVFHSHFARTHTDWVLYLRDYFPEIEEVVRLASMRTASVRIDEKMFYTTSFFNTDSSFFKVFGYRLLKGDPDKVLSEPGSLVISESIANKYFGEDDPVGQPVFSRHQFDTIYRQFTVTGVMEDFPPNTHLHAGMLGSIDDPREHIGWSYNYLLLREGTDPGEITTKFPAFLKDHLPEQEISWWTPHLQLVKDIHLYSEKDREIEPNGKIIYVKVFILVAILLLLVAFINYANLEVAAINRKMRFIFLNRVLGARIRDIVKFISVKNGVNSLMAAVTGMVLLILGLPIFNRLLQYHLVPGDGLDWLWIIFLSVLLTFIGILSGTFPVLLIRTRERLSQLTGRIFYQSGFSMFGDKHRMSVRLVIVILQFLTSIVLIFSTLIIYLQVDYMLKIGIGSGDKSILVLKNLPVPVLDNYLVFKQELLGNPLIREVSASMEEPSADVMDAMKFEMECGGDMHRDQLLNVMPADNNFLDFFGIPLLAGSNFPDYKGMEAPEHYIINETAMRKLGFRDPEEAVGHQFKLLFQVPGIFNGGQIIGVCRDFHFFTAAKPVKPLVIFQKHIWFWCFFIRIDEEKSREAIDFVNDTWIRIYPDFPFEYHFVDDLYAVIYKNEISQARILVIGSLLIILIACLGLISLMAYLVEARTKEIGIRIVTGASTMNILYRIGSRFLLWIVIAVAFALPLSWWLVTKFWLTNFTYTAGINWLIFIPAGAAVVVLALLVIIIQTCKAASRNPSDSLRYE